MNNKKQNIVTIGGGSGQSVLLSGLRDLEGIDITAIVSMTDNGGSTGRLRSELGVLPPGDILKCLIALSPHRDSAEKILLERFQTDGRLYGHNAGNLLLAMLSKYAAGFPEVIEAFSEILDIRGTILPVSLDHAVLVAELTDRTRIYGENVINKPQNSTREKIEDIFLVPQHGDAISVYPPVIKAINRADYIIIGPGDMFTSIIPNLIVPGVKEALNKTNAIILYIMNIMTTFGETHHFTAYDFVKKLEEFLGKTMDGIIYNTKKPNKEILKQYLQRKSVFVEIDQKDKKWNKYKIYASNILEAREGIVKHNSNKLSLVIRDIISTSL